MRHDDGYDRAAAQYSASYMSNAKWIRLFTAAARSGLVVERAQWNTIGSDHTFWEGFPKESDLLATRFGDGRFQLLEYKWIRSIYIPREFRPIENVGYTRKQDVDGLKGALEAAGAFQMEDAEGGLTILGYEP